MCIMMYVESKKKEGERRQKRENERSTEHATRSEMIAHTSSYIFHPLSIQLLLFLSLLISNSKLTFATLRPGPHTPFLSLSLYLIVSYSPLENPLSLSQPQNKNREDKGQKGLFPFNSLCLFFTTISLSLSLLRGERTTKTLKTHTHTHSLV